MNEKLNIHSLLSEHKFKIISEINKDFKCVICKEILVNAHQSSCGCHYCLVCINNYKNSGFRNCPGNTVECNFMDLSNISFDPRINKHIDNLIMRCLNQKCTHECRLIEIEDHMRFCSTGNVNCPLNNVGCESEEMNIDKLNDHMLSEIVNHNKILIDIIDNLRNEVRELREKDKCTADAIKSINDEVKLLKTQKGNIIPPKRFSNSIFDDKLNIEMKKGCSEKFDIQTETNKINKYLNMRDNGELCWQIKKISKLDWINCGFFYDKQNPYKMQVVLGNVNMEFRIQLFICCGAFDADLKWPCRADVTITLSAYDKNVVNKTITQFLKIDNPENNPCKYSKGEIKFSHSDLIKSKHFYKNCLLVCKVEFN